MADKSEINKGVLIYKQGLLNDIAKAFKEGLYNDVTFVMPDNVQVSTSKFMLGCRIPYFAKMLFGGLAGNLPSSPIPLNCCDSDIFKHILKFAWEGRISFLRMSIEVILKLLETSRFLCIDLLVEGIEDYLEYALEAKKIKPKDCILAFDFLVRNNFNEASTMLMFLDYIDLNLPSISSIPEFCSSEFAIKMLLSYEGRVCEEIDLFQAFVKWIEKNGDTISENDRKYMLSFFKLSKFDKADLVNIVRKSHLFDDKDICDTLEEHLDNVQKLVDSNTNVIEAQRLEIEGLQDHLDQVKRVSDSEKGVIVAQNELIEQLKRKISEREIVKFIFEDKVKSYLEKSGVGSRNVWQVPSKFETHFLNLVSFDLGKPYYKYTYCLESSQDGRNWEQLDYKFNEGGGNQVITFRRRKVKFLGVRVMKSRSESYESEIRPEISSLTAMLL